MKRYTVLGILAVGLLSVAMALPFPQPKNAGAKFAAFPVLAGGRVKPMDSVARNALLVLSGRQTLPHQGQRISANDWLLDVLFKPEVADDLPVFEINDPDVLGLLGIQQGRTRRYSFHDLVAQSEEIETQARRAQNVRAEQRSRFQSAVVRLREMMILYQKLQNSLRLATAENWFLEIEQFDEALKAGRTDPHAQVLSAFHERYEFMSLVAAFRPLPVPTDKEVIWLGVGDALMARFQAPALHPGILAYGRMGEAHRLGDKKLFEDTMTEYASWLTETAPAAYARTQWETLFNKVQPFYRALLLYAVVFLLLFLSFLLWTEPLRKSAYLLLLAAFIIHTVGLVARIWLQGRPPVTNLYSSAVFVGWVTVLLGIGLERLYRNGFGAMMAAGIGFLTQIIAHHLASQGDTLEMMRAVLDSNFWLATHVTMVTIGYSSTFLSGALGAAYIMRGLFSHKMSPEAGRAMARMVYGTVCFSTFFSFVGTILGGIWADQSWGRFWGWDPKENGALMIVLWNVLILHMRIGGFIGQKGLMTAAVFGNVVTALSWFGVNMLAIGLHSYGFMDKAFPWLAVFVVSQLALMGAGLLPDRFWASRPWPQADH